MAWAGRRSTGIVTPGSSIPTVVALTARSAFMVAARNAGSSSATAARRRSPIVENRSSITAAARAVRLPTVTRAAPAWRQAYTTACAAPPAPATTTSAPAIGRPIASSTPARKPGASVLNPTSRAVGVLATLLTAPIASRVGLHLVTQPGHDQLVRRGHAKPEPVGTARRLDGRFHVVGLQLQQDVPRVDSGGVERGVVHDLRVAPAERLAEQRDLPGHASVTRPPRRRAAPATASAGGEPAPRSTGT